MSLTEADIFDSCAQCGKRQSAVSNLTEQTFLINTLPKCGHKFCSSCVERELYKKRQFACLKCKTIVTRDKLSIKSLDETEVERDFSIRRKVKALYNKTEHDFKLLDDWKDYEEYVETLIYNLVNMIDVDATNKVIDEYKTVNSKEIAMNEYRKAEEISAEYRIIREHEQAALSDEQKFKENFATERQQKIEQKRQLNQIMLGERDPSTLSTNIVDNKVSSEGAPTSLASSEQSVRPATGLVGPNPVLAFLCQRAEPKPKLEYKRSNSLVRTNIDLRKMHQVGGYDFNSYDERNWSEIFSQCTAGDNNELEMVMS